MYHAFVFIDDNAFPAEDFLLKCALIEVIVLSFIVTKTNIINLHIVQSFFLLCVRSQLTVKERIYV